MHTTVNYHTGHDIQSMELLSRGSLGRLQEDFRLQGITVSRYFLSRGVKGRRQGSDVILKPTELGNGY